jgi:hypothetical protein
MSRVAELKKLVEMRKEVQNSINGLESELLALKDEERALTFALRSLMNERSVQ